MKDKQDEAEKKMLKRVAKEEKKRQKLAAKGGM